MNQLTKYFRDTFAEMKQVRWPTQSQALAYTLVVVAVCVVTAIFLSFFDFLFSEAIDQLIHRF